MIRLKVFSALTSTCDRSQKFADSLAQPKKRRELSGVYHLAGKMICVFLVFEQIAGFTFQCATKQIKSLSIKSLRHFAITKLGQMLSSSTSQTWTARQINQLLIEQGFQEKNPEGDPDYLPTVKGEKFCKMILNTAKGHGKTIQSLRWFKEVLEALEVNDH